MIAKINKIKILRFNYEPNNISTGIHNGIKWRLMEKKLLNGKFYRYEFLITYSDNISCNKALITGEIDIRDAVRIILSTRL